MILSQWCSSLLLFPFSFLICSLSIFPYSLQPGDVKKWHKRFPSSPPITLQFSFCPFLISYQSSHSTPLSSHSNGRNNSPSAPFLSFFLIFFFNHFFLNTTFILSTYTINLSFSHSMQLCNLPFQVGPLSSFYFLFFKTWTKYLSNHSSKFPFLKNPNSPLINLPAKFQS